MAGRERRLQYSEHQNFQACQNLGGALAEDFCSLFTASNGRFLAVPFRQPFG